MKRHIRFVTPLVATSGIVIGSACTHDFDRFEGTAQPEGTSEAGPDGGKSEASDAAVSDAKTDAPTVDAGPCAPKASCYSTRSTCGAECTKKKDDCYTACETAPGSKSFCRAKCRDEEDKCDDACRDTCHSCAGDGCTGACQ